MWNELKLKLLHNNQCLLRCYNLWWWTFLKSGLRKFHTPPIPISYSTPTMTTLHAEKRRRGDSFYSWKFCLRGAIKLGKGFYKQKSLNLCSTGCINTRKFKRQPSRRKWYEFVIFQTSSPSLPLSTLFCFCSLVTFWKCRVALPMATLHSCKISWRWTLLRIIIHWFSSIWVVCSRPVDSHNLQNFNHRLPLVLKYMYADR